MSDQPPPPLALVRPGDPPPRPTASQFEALLLGCLLEAEEPSALIDLSGLSTSDLQDPRVRICWDLAVRCVKRNRPIDAISLHSLGKTFNILHDGDLAWLQGLQASNTLDAKRFAVVAGDLRTTRRAAEVVNKLQEITRQIQARGLNHNDVSGKLEGITIQLARDYTPTVTAEGEVVEVVDEWFRPKDSSKGRGLFVPTGLKVLDAPAPEGAGLIGYVPGLNQIFGDPGVGKSGVIGSGMESQLEAGYTVGFFGLEEGYRWLVKRLFAKHLGIKISDVGREVPIPGTKLYDELLERAPKLAEVLKRLIVYSVERCSINELVRRGTDMVLNHGCQILYVDHIGEIVHDYGTGGGADSGNWAVANTYRRLRDMGNKRNVPVVALAHRKPDARERKGPPRPNDVGLTGEAEKMVRRQLALWKEGTRLRCTVTKNNEGEPDVTVEFVRLVEAGMIDPELGHRVSLEAEAREKAKEKREKAREQRDADALYVRERNKKLKAAEKAAEQPPEPVEPEAEPQLDLLGPPVEDLES